MIVFPARVWWWRIKELMSDEFWQHRCVEENKVAYLRQEVKKLKAELNK